MHTVFLYVRAICHELMFFFFIRCVDVRLWEARAPRSRTSPCSCCVQWNKLSANA